MEPVILYAIIGALSLIVGIVAGKIIFAKNTKKQVEEAEAQAQSIIAIGLNLDFPQARQVRRATQHVGQRL